MGSKKYKNDNEAVNMITTLNGQEDNTQKELNMRLNEYIILVSVALATFGVLMYQISNTKKK